MLNQVENFEILNKRSNILCKVKNYIDINLYPSNNNFSNDMSIREILSDIKITENDYYWALSVSPETYYEIHLKSCPGSCIINNYNSVLLKTKEANLDIQPVHNYYKALTYMTAYFSKSESEVSEALKLAAG